MKIIYNESTYLVPENNIINVISNTNQNQLIECLDMYFNKHKKNYCKIYDCMNHEILPNEATFIYIPFEQEVEQNFLLKPKSFLNCEISNFIEENTLEFSTFEKIRDLLKECSSDRGMFTLNKILGHEIHHELKFQLNNFDIHHLVSMLEIDIKDFSCSDVYKILYNLLIFENRNKYSIIYIDFPIYEKDLNWIQSYRNGNIFFLINNDCLCCDITKTIKEFSMILLSNQDYMESLEYDISEFSVISYLQNDFIMHHLEMQTEKNIRLLNEFNDKNTTFCLIFSDSNTLKLL